MRPSLYSGFRLLLVLAVAPWLGGCQTAGFYSQAIRGQWQIWRAQKPLPTLLADSNTPPTLRARFERVIELREFARTELGLPVGRHYLRYADLHRPYVVWNVFAAPEFSLQPRSWWYPVVGRLDYRGFFAATNALRCARQLREQGYDVSVGGVEAYSTLGWFADPLLNTFLFQDDHELAELLFHELTHQKLFIPGDTEFNEAFATAVAEEGVRRWLRHQGQPDEIARQGERSRRKQAFVGLVISARDELKVLYGETNEQHRAHAPQGEPASVRAAKQAVFDRLRERYRQTRASWGTDTTFDAWFEQRLNNALLNTVATYYRLVPAFERILAEKSGDLPAFFAEVNRLKSLPKKERHRLLQQRLVTPPAR